MKFSKVTATLLCGVSLLPGAATAHSLPIGDGKVSTSPKQGYVYSCQTNFRPIGPRAPTTGEWFDAENGTWDPDIKPFVDGSVSWPNEIEISVRGQTRVIAANGLPSHTTGNFPVSPSDDAYQFDRNPNGISAQNVILRLDTIPQLANTPTCVPMGMIGFTLAGAALYNGLDASGLDAAAHEIQDKCNGHPQGAGEYHYHSLSPCIEDTNSGPNGHSDLLGYALDGFGIFGLNESADETMWTSDLDECHGHVGAIEWDGQLVEMYHYHFTQDYPYTLGCFAGVVTQSQMQQARPRLRQGDGQYRDRAGQRPNRENRVGSDRRP